MLNWFCLAGAMHELGLPLSWSTLVITDVFNSNKTYLAGAREYLDLIIDSVGGEMEIIGGSNEYCIDANWKLLAENSIDGYHALPTHDSYFKYLIALGTDLQGGVKGTSHDLGHGHAVLEYAAPWGRPIAKWEPLFDEHAREEIATLRADLVAKYGEVSR